MDELIKTYGPAVANAAYRQLHWDLTVYVVGLGVSIALTLAFLALIVLAAIREQKDFGRVDWSMVGLAVGTAFFLPGVMALYFGSTLLWAANNPEAVYIKTLTRLVVGR